MSRLLLVDDEPDIRAIAKMALERIGGWDGDRGRLGGRGRRGGRPRDCPDVVLLDVMMPDVDGPATLERLRPLLGQDVPVIFLTAKVAAADVARLKALGAAGVIAKPFDPLGLPASSRRSPAADDRPAHLAEGRPSRRCRAGRPCRRRPGTGGRARSASPRCPGVGPEIVPRGEQVARAHGGAVDGRVGELLRERPVEAARVRAADHLAVELDLERRGRAPSRPRCAGTGSGSGSCSRAGTR